MSSSSPPLSKAELAAIEAVASVFSVEAEVLQSGSDDTNRHNAHARYALAYLLRSLDPQPTLGRVDQVMSSLSSDTPSAGRASGRIRRGSDLMNDKWFRDRIAACSEMVIGAEA